MKIENDIIFENYIASILNETDVAFTSKIRSIINTLQNELQTNPLLKNPNIFFNKARTLILKNREIPNDSKIKLIRHLRNAGGLTEKESNIPGNSIDLMLDYLKKSISNYEEAGYMSTPLTRGKMYDPETEWNKPPPPELLSMHYGDVVKYVGPINPHLNTHDNYMIVRKEEHPIRNFTGKIMTDADGKPMTRITFFVKLYDSQKADVHDARELGERINNPNYLKYIGNNLKDQKKNFLQSQEEIHQRDKELYIYKHGKKFNQ